MLNGIASAAALLISGRISDQAQASGNQLAFFTGLRMFVFAVCVVEVWVYSRPREFSYPRQSGMRALLAIGTVVRKDHAYTAVMALVFGWNAASYLTSTALDVHVLQVVGIPYMLVTALTASLALFLLTLAPLWKTGIRRWGWLKTFSLATLLHAPFSASIGFITPENYSWLYVLSRCAQLACYVGIVIPYSNMPYLALREENRTACLSLFLLISNAGALTGQMLGTILMSVWSELRFPMFGSHYGAVSVLMCLQGAGLLMLSAYSFWLHWYLEKIPLNSN